MYRRAWAVAVGALFLMFSMTVSAAACPVGHDQPFRAVASGQIVYDPANELGCASGATTVVTAEGHATHLGKLTVLATHCEVATGPGTGRSIQGRMTLQAANGDRIKGTYETDWAFADGKVSVTGWLTIKGGTGKFKHARGMLWQNHVISVVSPAPPWPLEMSFTGRIDF
ncbi:MAG TPA: hypothetical protein VIJ41_03400 [Candidatus Nanopelagicales bacterium]